jgi:hypothetical protein
LRSVNAAAVAKVAFAALSPNAFGRVTQCPLNRLDSTEKYFMLDAHVVYSMKQSVGIVMPLGDDRYALEKSVN